MDVKQLEAFVAVAKYKNFSKAARELFLTRTYSKCSYTKFRKRTWNYII